MTQLNQYINILKDMDNTKYYMHEKYLCRAVLHITSPDSLSRRETFSKILKLIQNGNIPNGDGSRWHSPINPIPDITLIHM